MKTIQVVFTKSTKKLPVFSWLIQWAEHTDYSHVAIRMIDSETQLPIYYQSSHTMVNCMGEEEFLAEEKILNSFEFQIDDSLQVALHAFAIKQLGKPYGVVSTVGLGWVQLNKLFGRKTTNPFKQVGATYVCSQF